MSSLERTKYRRRKLTSGIMLGLCIGSAAICVAMLLLILGYVLFQGVSYLNLGFITHAAKPVGQTGGGMRNEIIGTLILVGIGTVMAVPVGLMTGIYLSGFGGARGRSVGALTADGLTGIPSIVIGMFAYIILVRPLHTFSALSAGVALSIIMIPVIARTAEESLRLVPGALREAALALGISRWRTILSVVVPGALTGIITGIMLAMARIAGETAPLIFTALGNSFGYQGLDKPVGALSLQIWKYAISPYQDWHRQAWAAAFLLMMMIMIISVIVRWLTSRGRVNHGG